MASFSGGLFRVADPTGARPILEPVEYEHRLRGSPRALYRDRDDNIWVGMRGGLLRLSENTFQHTGPLDGLNRDGVRTAAVAADGSIWIATTQALNRVADGHRQSFAISQTRALHADRSGAMWVATDQIVGRYTMGRLVRERIPDVQASRVNSLTTTADALWLCTAFRGVLSWKDNTLTSHRQPGDTQAVRQYARGSAGPRVGRFQRRRRRAARERPGPRVHREGRPGARLGVADRAGQRRRGVGRHVGRREPLPGRPPHVHHDGARAHHRDRPGAGTGYAGLRLGGGAVGRRADALPCGRDGPDRKGPPPPSRLHALRRERWAAARHADVAERRRRRARSGGADLGR